MTQGIYKLINPINNQVYIGQSIDIENRFNEHVSMLKKNKHHAYKLQQFYNQNKRNKNFKISCEIIEIVKDRKHLNAREQCYIKMYDSYYNGFNSTSMNGDPVQTQKKERQNNKINKINQDKLEYKYLIHKYKDNLYLQYSGYSDTYLYRVNEAIKYFVKNYNLNLYKAEIVQHRHDVDLSVIDMNFTVVQRYEYKTKWKSMGINRYTYKYSKEKYSQWDYDRYKKFDNIVKSKNRYKWFLHKYHNLDSQILQFNTLKYTKNKYSIPFKHIRAYVGYEYNNFRKHIIEDLEIQILSKELGVTYPHGRAELTIENNGLEYKHNKNIDDM